MSKLGIEGRAQLRLEKKQAAESFYEKLEKLDARLTAEEQKSHQLEISLMAALGAYRIIASELQRISPASAALIQAQALLAIAYPGFTGMDQFFKEGLSE